MKQNSNLSLEFGAFNLLNDYGKVMAAQVEAACMLHIATHALLHAKQNAQMMYECMINLITEEAKF